MDFDSIFQAYYSLYRADSDVPGSTDTEYIVAMRLANEAINYWANYDNTPWNELLTTNLTAVPTGVTPGDSVIVAGQTNYATSSRFDKPAGFITIGNPTTGNPSYYNRIESHEAQFLTPNTQYAYFTGNRKDGYVLHLSPAPNATAAGSTINYAFYKRPTYFTTGSDKSEMSNPYFIVHRLLANQFRASRNPYYNSALRDAEDSIRKMQLANNAGSWDNNPVMQDNSGTSWGR